jgi:RNA polymerase sigma-70 factor (ECF subfamily)
VQNADAAADAFGVLFDRHAKAVYNHCYLLTGSWSTAQEAVSSTFLAAWRQHRSIQLIHESALPWLFTVATNLVRQEHRQLSRRIRLAERLARHAGDDAVPDHSDAVASRVDEERRWHHLVEAIARLPRGEREAFTLCVWSEISYPAAAAVLGIAESSVRARVSRARSRLRRWLGPDQLTGFAQLHVLGGTPR